MHESFCRISDSLLLCEGLSVARASGVVFLVFHDTANRNAIGLQKAQHLASLAALAASAMPHDKKPQAHLQAAGTAADLHHFLAQSPPGALALVSTVPNVFLSGGDVRELARIAAIDHKKSPEHAQNELTNTTAFTQYMRLFCDALSNLPFPTFSLLAGHAYGGGAEVALATDFRMAATHSLERTATSNVALHFWQAKWGVPGGWQGMARLSALCPALDARRVSLLFAASQSLPFEALARLGLFDFLPPATHSSIALPHSPEQSDAAFTSEQVSFQGNSFSFTLPGWLWNLLHSFAAEFQNCPSALRDDFLRREKFAHTPDGDNAFFARYWMQEEHRTRLLKAAERKSGGKP